VEQHQVHVERRELGRRWAAVDLSPRPSATASRRDAQAVDLGLIWSSPT
jgi:hypothetical protein